MENPEDTKYMLISTEIVDELVDMIQEQLNSSFVSFNKEAMYQFVFEKLKSEHVNLMQFVETIEALRANMGSDDTVY